MKTDDLIAALAADTAAATAPEALLRRSLPPALLLAFAGLLLILGLRADPGAALAPMTLLKTLLPLVLGALSIVLGLRLARPGAAVGRLPWLIAALPVLAGALALLRLATSDPAGWQMQAVGKTVLPCLVSIPAMAALPLAALLWSLRQGACLAPARAGFVAGLAAGGVAAAMYSLHCIEDSPLFWAAWYSTAILVTATAGAVLGARLLRW